VALHAAARPAVFAGMSTKSRQTIYGGRIMGAKIRAESARKRAAEAARETDRAEAEAWSIQMEGYGGPAQPSPTIGQCLNGGYGWLEVECHRCKTRASIPLDAIRRQRNTPIWKLEAALKCRSCKKGRYAPPVHMIKLTQEREIASYIWVHPDDDRQGRPVPACAPLDFAFFHRFD
jgi:Fe-S-cluster-containing hydrogenase component 2